MKIAAIWIFYNFEIIKEQFPWKLYEEIRYLSRSKEKHFNLFCKVLGTNLLQVGNKPILSLVQGTIHSFWAIFWTCPYFYDSFLLCSSNYWSKGRLIWNCKSQTWFVTLCFTEYHNSNWHFACICSEQKRVSSDE